MDTNLKTQGLNELLSDKKLNVINKTNVVSETVLYTFKLVSTFSSNINASATMDIGARARADLNGN